jgi:aspartate aminotransferase
MTISKKIHSFISQASWIRKMFEEGLKMKRLYGEENVFDFSLGNPNLSPPTQFKEMLREVAGQDMPDMHAYMPNAGYPETREAIADFIYLKHNASLSFEHIIMSCGAGGALNVILKALIDPGNEVIIPIPYFVEYQFYVDNAGGIPILVNTKEDFSLDIDAMKQAVTEETKVVLINSPNNPTGKVYDQKAITALSEMLEEKEKSFGKSIFLLSDEPYSDIVYNNIKAPCILKSYQNSIIATSYSKSFSIPGERIGYIAVNPQSAFCEELIEGIVLCNRILGFVNAPALMQRVIARIQDTCVDVSLYERKRDMLCDGLSSIGYVFHRPEGAFYLFPESPIKDDVLFVKTLQEKRILAVPGSGFGGPGHFRIAYCVDDKTIINAMEGFRAAFGVYR